MRMLSFTDLKPLKGISFSPDHVLRMVKEGKFPKPVKLGASDKRQTRNFWVEEEIDKWLAERVKERDVSGVTAA